MTLTKAQIAEMIAEQNGFAKAKSTQLVENMIEIINRNLEDGEDVLVSGFGKFCVRNKKQRRGRKPSYRIRLDAVGAQGGNVQMFAKIKR